MKCQICGGEVVLSKKVRVGRGCPARRQYYEYSPCGSCGVLHDPEDGVVQRGFRTEFIVFVNGKVEYLEREQIKVTHQVREEEKWARGQILARRFFTVAVLIVAVFWLVFYLVSHR